MIPLSDANASHQMRPYVTWGLITLNALVFVYTFLLSDFETQVFNYRFGFIPAELTQGIDYTLLQSATGNVNIATPYPTWGTLLSAMFIHGGLMHFGSNMLYLWIFGDNIENWMGHWKFVIFYLVTGLAASGAQLLADTSSQVPNIGASGAIAGVLGGYLLLFPHNRVNTLFIFYFVSMARVRAIWVLGGWFVLQLFSGVGSLGGGQTGGGVAYWAHIGGFAAGFGIVFLWRAVFPPPPPPLPPPDELIWDDRW